MLKFVRPCNKDGSQLAYSPDANIGSQSSPAASDGKATGSYAAPGITSAVYYGRTGEVMQTATVYPCNYSRRVTAQCDNRGNILMQVDSLTMACVDTTSVMVSRYQYDSVGKPTQMTVTLNGRKATVSTTYDGVGRVASQQLGNEVVLIHTLLIRMSLWRGRAVTVELVEDTILK